MGKIIRTGILALLLVSPVFVLLFLYTFGESRFNIPVFFAEDSVMVKGKYKVTKAAAVPGFRLLAQDSSMVGNTDLAGSVYVAGFQGTPCTRHCREKLAQLARVQESFRNDNRLKILSFTIDEMQDNLSALRNFATEYRSLSGKWYWLAGNKESIVSLARNGFHLDMPENRDTATALSETRLVLVDNKGWIRGFYDGTNKKDADRLITEIAILLKEYKDS